MNSNPIRGSTKNIADIKFGNPNGRVTNVQQRTEGNEQNDEECDATDDHSSNVADKINRTNKYKF